MPTLELIDELTNNVMDYIRVRFDIKIDSELDDEVYSKIHNRISLALKLRGVK